MTHGIRVVSMVAAVVALNQIPGVGPRPREADRQLYITTDRLSYRLTQNGRVWAGGMVVRLTNYTNDTIYLRPACGHRAPEHQFAPIVGDFFYPPYERPAGCPFVAASGVSLNLEARKPAFAIAPSSSYDDTLRFTAAPYIRPDESAPREGIARYQLRYTPYVKRGFLRKHWTIDRHVWFESDPFELITPGFER
jgi:hypothetical protein